MNCTHMALKRARLNEDRITLVALEGFEVDVALIVNYQTGALREGNVARIT